MVAFETYSEKKKTSNLCPPTTISSLRALQYFLYAPSSLKILQVFSFSCRTIKKESLHPKNVKLSVIALYPVNIRLKWGKKLHKSTSSLGFRLKALARGYCAIFHQYINAYMKYGAHRRPTVVSGVMDIHILWVRGSSALGDLRPEKEHRYNDILTKNLFIRSLILPIATIIHSFSEESQPYGRFVNISCFRIVM